MYLETPKEADGEFRGVELDQMNWRRCAGLVEEESDRVALACRCGTGRRIRPLRQPLDVEPANERQPLALGAIDCDPN